MAGPDFPQTLTEFQRRFAREDDCRQYLVECRWSDDYRCPRCGHLEAYTLSTRSLLQCTSASCRHQVSVTAGTVMHRTRMPLQLWFLAAYLVTTHTPGFSALQLQRQLGLNRYETAWAMLQKIRRAMVRPERDRIFGTVEVDEAYVGGVEEGRRGGRQRDSNKAIVVSSKHLPHYVNEFVFRFNRRRTPMAAFQSLLGLTTQHASTTYKMLYGAESTG